MIDIQTRNTFSSDGWRTGVSKPAGLYGELPPLPAYPHAAHTSAPKPHRKRSTAG